MSVAVEDTGQRDVDVAVIGAGYAGLSAARELRRSGLRVVVLEARDRVGGRTLTERSTEGRPLDLGGQWIGVGQHRIAGLAREYGVATVRTHTTGDSTIVDRGRSRRWGQGPSLGALDLAAGLWWVATRLDALAMGVDVEQPWAGRHALQQDGTTVAEWLRRTLPAGRARRYAGTLLGEAMAADVDRVWLLDLLFALRTSGGFDVVMEAERGAQQGMFADGADAVARAMAAELGGAVRLGWPVGGLTQDDGTVRVAGPRGSVTARRAVVALPPTLAGRLSYDPPLPPARDQLTQRAAMGSILKVLAVYDRPFWREEGLSGEVVHLDHPPMTVVDGSYDGGGGVLVGLVAGRAAHDLAAMDGTDRRRVVVEALARGVGERARGFVDWREKHWDADPWSRGGYAGLHPPGTLTSVGPALRVPVGRLHWAGAETATSFYGYIEGAVQSGRRAAREVMDLESG